MDPVVTDEVAEQLAHVEALELGATSDVMETGRQPLVEGREQPVVGDVGPRVAEGAVGVLEAGLEHPGRSRPAEHPEAGGPDAVEQGGGGGVARFGRTLGRGQHEGSEAPFGAHPQVVALGVPGQGGDALDALAGGELEVGLVEPGRHPDPMVGAPPLGPGVRSPARPRRGRARR